MFNPVLFPKYLNDIKKELKRHQFGWKDFSCDPIPGSCISIVSKISPEIRSSILECSDGNIPPSYSSSVDLLVGDKWSKLAQNALSFNHPIKDELESVIDTLLFAEGSVFIATSALHRGFVICINPLQNNREWSSEKLLLEIIHEETHLSLDMLFLLFPPQEVFDKKKWACLQNAFVFTRLTQISDELDILKCFKDENLKLAKYFRQECTDILNNIAPCWCEILSNWVDPILNGNPNPLADILPNASYIPHDLTNKIVEWDER